MHTGTIYAVDYDPASFPDPVANEAYLPDPQPHSLQLDCLNTATLVRVMLAGAHHHDPRACVCTHGCQQPATADGYGTQQL
jgi:hypothetical protein